MKGSEEILEITNPFIEYGKRKGKDEGRQEGIKIGVDRGRDEGRQEGIEIGVDRGREEVQIKVVKGMLNEGLSVELIAKVTQLSIEKVEQMRQNNK